MPGQVATEREVAGRLSEVRAPGFVARERELAALGRALAAPPSVVLVEGEAGIGKSRLVREFLACPAAGGLRALVAACPPFRQPCTLGPLVDALRQDTGEVAGLGLSPLAGALRPLFPEWAAGLPAACEPLEDATAARYRLFGALAELLGRLQVRVLVAEDVHWADEATLEFLLFLASRQPSQLSLLVTYRPEDVPADSLLRRLSSRLPAGTTSARVTLGRLDVAGTAGLVASMLGNPVTETFAAFLHEHTGGLPLAIEESVRLLHERADLIRRGGEWVRRRNLDRVAVPPTVRDAVLERTGRLDAAALAVLRAAAVLTDPAGEPTLTAVTGLAAGQVRAGLAGALGCGLLAEDEDGLVSFRHVLAARAVYEAIPVTSRREMHLRAARALEGISPRPVAPLARHFREAGETGEWCHYAEQAADLALASGDEATAATLLHDLVTGAGLPAGAVARLTGKIRPVALAGYTPVSDLVRSLRSVLDRDALTGAERAEVGFQMGRILVGSGDYQAGAAELERAIPGLAHRPAEAAHAMTLLGWPRYTLWPAGVHRRWLDRAAATAADPSIPASDRQALAVNRATALLQMGEESGWAEAARILCDTTPAAREQLQITRGNLNVGELAMSWGRYAEAGRSRLARARVLAESCQYLRLRGLILGSQLHLDWFTGGWTGLAGRAADLAGLDDAEPLVRLEADLVGGLLDAATGARTGEERLRLVGDECLRRGIVDVLPEPAAALARLRLREGRAGDALTLTEDPMRVITVKGIWLWATDVAPARVEALAAAGRIGEAAKLATDFAQWLRGRNAPAPQAALVLCQAILAECRGQATQAAVLFARAASAWEALPRPYYALLARERQGCCLLAAGQTEAGLAVLGEVFQALSELGARRDAVRVMRTLNEHGVQAKRPWWGGRRGYGDQLSPRESEVVRLVAAGRTNQEITQELCRSLSTVRMQLKSAMRKLGVSSRTALAARAVEAGITAADQPAGSAAAAPEAR